MAELLENGTENTAENAAENTEISTFPADTSTAISPVAVQALADALAKIEAYTPTTWVDNEAPDIDAAHLNKAEQAIMRVTTAMNSAVDTIKDLQSQITTTNNNLSDISNRFYKITSETDFSNLLKSGYYYGKLSQNTPDGTTTSNWVVEIQAFDNNPNYVYQRATRASDKRTFTRYRNGSAWSDWEIFATKSDLSSRASYDSQADNLDTPSDVIIARTPANPTGYPSNLGGNSCLVLQLNPGQKYSAQLAFGFSKDRLAIRRKNGSDTWTSWKYVDFTIS